MALSACASQPAAPLAPQPLRSIDEARFFTGRWYEIARTPMQITNGCVAGTTDYIRGANGKLRELDACHMNTPADEEKSIQGPVTILNPGENNKTLVNYRLLYGLITISRTYWITDHGVDYDWFMFTDPGFKNISIFTRTPRPSSADVAKLTARARALGYDTTKLEYPTEFPSGAD
ncbi:lipocalin family protein [Acidocella aromatica]|uniref:Outer membrane lipoprotein Blc n=1 Tax=Acidocella aromatica TaxID=1303579 RepID=A0A840VEI0_9PROT|nr:lipocalin family protein [Acidocella aromatica]MBB5373287.1 apolipoprotein D and lipocalin family protein [Acidocella aromatica]